MSKRNPNQNRNQNLSVGDTAHATLILAPTGKDAELAKAVLAEAGLAAETAIDLPDVCARLQAKTYGALLLAEEGLTAKGPLELIDTLHGQAPWSDLPIIVLSLPGEPTIQAARALNALSMSANVSLLERPFRLPTLVATVQSALRARARQYQVRDLLEMQARALRQKDDFISIASHELKTPLTSIGLQAYINKKRLAAGEPLTVDWVGKLVDTTDRQVARLMRLVDDMLDISRINSGQIRISKQPVDLVQLVRAETERLAPQLAAADCAIEIETTAQAMGEWDPHRMEQVVGNLLTNAIRYAPGKPIKVSVACNDTEATVCVQDYGDGIPLADQARIFERFERAGSAVAGLGLGLYICRELVSLHQGTIEVESKPGQGARFTVRVPIAGSATDK